MAQLSDTGLAIERDQQAEDEARNVSTWRTLKVRLTGATGSMMKLLFNPSTGRLEEKPLSFNNDPQPEGDEFDERPSSGHKDF